MTFERRTAVFTHGGMIRSIFKSKRLDLLLLFAGVALVLFAAGTYIGGKVYSRVSIARFHASSQVTATGNNGKDVDFSLWSPKRIEQYKTSLAEHFDEPIALLKVSKIGLEVPVFEGTDERVLNRGVGRIAGTASAGELGNLGIAGHRDGFFRGLKDVAVGDRIEVETKVGTRIYVIDRISLVDPSDVSVLKDGPVPSLTLVTCYPFYFVGSAPQRYIVHASLK